MKATHVNTLRIPELDFTKGALVLIMVLYHWLDYFIGPQSEIFRYLRFLTPSFICVSGFLISNIYLSKYEIVDPRLPKRLGQRGLKLLGIFIVLNVAIRAVFENSYNGKILFGSLSSISAIFVSGNTLIPGVGKAAAFYVLVPIAYLLLLSAGLVIVRRLYKYTFQVAFTCSLLSVFILELIGLKNGNLELITIGLLGVMLGCVPMNKINNFVGHPYLIGSAYLLYTAAITLWNVVYSLQIVGVCLSLMLIYLLGKNDGEAGKARGHIMLLGKYSLVAYIAQILILQLLHRSFRVIGLAPGTLAISFLAAIGLTLIAVVVVDRARTCSRTVDGLYKAVFA